MSDEQSEDVFDDTAPFYPNLKTYEYIEDWAENDSEDELLSNRNEE